MAPGCGTELQIEAQPDGTKERLTCPTCGVQFSGKHATLKRDATDR
jgi:hypothetical protein